jgi:tryptophan-rich sensory protein
VIEGIVMVVLTVFGYGSYLVWINGGPYFTKTFCSLLFYSVTLVLEWTKIVFGPSELDFATVHAAVSLLFAIITGILFFLVHRKAGYMCILYISWLISSTVLFYNLWILNSDADWFARRSNLLSNIGEKNQMLKISN